MVQEERGQVQVQKEKDQVEANVASAEKCWDGLPSHCQLVYRMVFYCRGTELEFL